MAEERMIPVVMKWSLGYRGKLYGPSINIGTHDKPKWTKIMVPEAFARTMGQLPPEKGESEETAVPERDNVAVDSPPESDNTGVNTEADIAAIEENPPESEPEQPLSEPEAASEEPSEPEQPVEPPKKRKRKKGSKK